MAHPGSLTSACGMFFLGRTHAVEDKRRTAFLAPDASVVISMLMMLHHTVGGRLRYRKPVKRLTEISATAGKFQIVTCSAISRKKGA